MSEFLTGLIRATVPREVRNWFRSPSRSAEWLCHAARPSLGATRSIDLLSGVQLRCHRYAYKVSDSAKPGFGGPPRVSDGSQSNRQVRHNAKNHHPDYRSNDESCGEQSRAE